jgi:hypothetical protein
MAVVQDRFWTILNHCSSLDVFLLAYIYNAVAKDLVDRQFSQKKGHLSAQSNKVLTKFYHCDSSLIRANSFI